MRSRPWCARSCFLLHDEDGTPAGRILGGVYFGPDFGRQGDLRRSYDGLVRGEPPTLYASPGNVVLGVIEGLVLQLVDGHRARMTSYPESPNPNLIPRIEDADQFRAALDLLSILEERNAEQANRLRVRLELAMFYQCPSCRNDPLRRDECSTCSGDGFVPESFSLPPA